MFVEGVEVLGVRFALAFLEWRRVPSEPKENKVTENSKANQDGAAASCLLGLHFKVRGFDFALADRAA